jgi:hypothetical protein
MGGEGGDRVILNSFLRTNFVILPKLRRNWRGEGVRRNLAMLHLWYKKYQICDFHIIIKRV